MLDFNIFILSGGKSSRMKKDKSLMLFDGKSMTQHIVDRFRSLNHEIFIISNNKSHQCFGVPVIEDNYKNCGPIGGIEAGLSFSKIEQNIFLTCDSPFIEHSLIKYLNSNPTKSEIVFTKDEIAHPFPGLYSKSIHDKLKTLIPKGLRKMTDLENYFNVTQLDCSHFNNNNFINFNTPEDIKYWNENNA